jgi:hypothetical protein
MNERAPRKVESVQGSSDRVFGLVFATFFLLVGLRPLLRAQSGRLWALVASGVFLAAALWMPRLLAPLNRVWTKVGLVLHVVMSPVALGILFFGAITPTGLVMRLFGKDPLRLRLDSTVASYWIVRTPPGPTADSLRNQF